MEGFGFGEGRGPGGWGWGYEKGSHTVIWYDMIRSCNLEFDLHEH